MASETGEGQTESRNTLGVTDRHLETDHSRIGWEAERDGVIVPYAKCEETSLDPEYLRARGTRREVGGPTLQA